MLEWLFGKKQTQCENCKVWIPGAFCGECLEKIQIKREEELKEQREKQPKQKCPFCWKKKTFKRI